MINVFIIDDHPFIIEGVVKALDSYKDEVRVMGTATSCEALLEKIRPDIVDVILLDLVMPKVSGIECYKAIMQKTPDIKVLALTGELDTHKLFEAWIVGIDAIIPKYYNGKDLVAAIKQVHEGQRFTGKGLPDIFRTASITRDDNAPKLTRREGEVLRMLSTGLSRKEVADKINVDAETVHFHCKNIFKKFNRKRLADVLHDAREYKIIP